MRALPLLAVLCTASVAGAAKEAKTLTPAGTSKQLGRAIARHIAVLSSAPHPAGVPNAGALLKDQVSVLFATGAKPTKITPDRAGGVSATLTSPSGTTNLRLPGIHRTPGQTSVVAVVERQAHVAGATRTTARVFTAAQPKLKSAGRRTTFTPDLPLTVTRGFSFTDGHGNDVLETSASAMASPGAAVARTTSFSSQRTPTDRGEPATRVVPRTPMVQP